MRYLLSVGDIRSGGSTQLFRNFPRLDWPTPRHETFVPNGFPGYIRCLLTASLVACTRQLQEREVCQVYVSILTASTLWRVISALAST
jgi:hypothetical protein